MRISILTPLAVSGLSTEGGSSLSHLQSQSLVQLGLADEPIATSALRSKAKAQFMSLMHDAEEKAKNDPAVLKADKVLKDAEDKFNTDSHHASDLLTSIKTRLSKSKSDLTDEEKNAAIDAKEIKKFTDLQYAKLQESEKKFMELQQKKISSSFAQLPAIDSSFVQMVKGHDGSKATQEINEAEKQLSVLSSKIKTRVEKLSHMLGTPGHQFEGEVVL